MDDTQPYPAPLGPGSLLAGRYRLHQPIGRGGVADVYRAEDQLLGRPVAIKIFRLDGSGLDDEERHQGEMRLLARLNHPGLVAIYDAGVDQDATSPRPYLVMELVLGQSLSQRLRSGPLTLDHTITLAGELAASLAYIHQRQIVHRDVKPANVLLADSGPPAAKLADFGIARSSTDPRLTGDGLTLGTAQYLSPEQALGIEVGPPSDIYSLGLVLLECLTGVAAFTGTAIEAAVARLNRDPVIPDGLEPALAGLLGDMTAREPSLRPTASQVVQRLGRPVGLADPEPATALFPPLLEPTVPVRLGGRGRRLVLAAGGAVAILLAVVLGDQLTHSGPAADQPKSPLVSSTAPSSAARTPIRAVSTPRVTVAARSSSVRTSAAAPAPKPQPKPKPPKKSHPGGKHH